MGGTSRPRGKKRIMQKCMDRPRSKKRILQKCMDFELREAMLTREAHPGAEARKESHRNAWILNYRRPCGRGRHIQAQRQEKNQTEMCGF